MDDEDEELPPCIGERLRDVTHDLLSNQHEYENKLHTSDHGKK